MYISNESAQTIINEVSSILNQQLNFMNAEGVIIASTNQNRIGQFHEGAARMIRESLAEFTILSDDAYQGAKKGCNFPLQLDDTVVGAIGITGESQEVYKYGQIIKKMTEILLRDYDSMEKRKIEERIRQRFLDDWTLTSIDVTERGFQQRAKAQGIDLAIRRRVLVFRIRDMDKYSDSSPGQKTIDMVNRTVRRLAQEVAGGIFSKTASSMICLSPLWEEEQLRAFADNVLQKVKAQHGIELVAGADSNAMAAELSVFHGYQQALKALRASLMNQTSPICFYDALTYELFLEEISDHSKEQFIRQVFRGVSRKEREEYIKLIRTLYECDGSLQAAAEAHFIHKNTLQYRLRVLAEKTGYDPRKYYAIPLYSLALLFERE